MENQTNIKSNIPSELDLFIHDLVSPLTNIGLSLEHIRTQINSDPIRLEKTLLRTIKSVNRLYYMTQIKNKNKMHYRVKYFNLQRTIEQLIYDNFSSTFETQNISFSINCERSISILGSKYLFERVINNIISNSIDAIIVSSNRLSHLSITAMKTKSTIQICISDDGCGMDEQTKLNIFLPRFSTKRDHKGIGLSTCTNIINSAFQGSIQIHSVINLGTTVEINIPVKN